MCFFFKLNPDVIVFNTLFIYFIYLFMTVLGLLVFVWGLSLVAASGGHSSSRCAGLSLSRPLPLRGTGSRRAGSVVVVHGPSCSVACGIFPDQGSNPCPLHWQADSQPLRHQGSPYPDFLAGRRIDLYRFQSQLEISIMSISNMNFPDTSDVVSLYWAQQ